MTLITDENMITNGTPKIVTTSTKISHESDVLNGTS